MKLYMGEFETQRSFHGVIDHPKRTSDEQVMVVRSWRTQQENPVVISYIWAESGPKWLSIESKNSHNGILTKELCKLQAVKKISNLQHLQQ